MKRPNRDLGNPERPCLLRCLSGVARELPHAVLDHVRQNEPGTDCIDRHTMGCSLEGNLFRQSQHRMLGGHVRCSVRADGHLARGRGDVDHSPTPTLEHLTDDLPDRVEVGVHVHPVVVLPRLVAVTGNRFVVKHACAVDQNVDFPKLFVRTTDCLFHLIPVAHVCRNSRLPGPRVP